MLRYSSLRALSRWLRKAMEGIVFSMLSVIIMSCTTGHTL
jgi:hypothetical protein